MQPTLATKLHTLCPITTEAANRTSTAQPLIGTRVVDAITSLWSTRTGLKKAAPGKGPYPARQAPRGAIIEPSSLNPRSAATDAETSSRASGRP